MGADKAAMRLGGLTMLERVVAELRRGFDEVIVVAGAPAAEAASALSAGSARLLWDSAAFEGPVKALRLGLAATGAEVAFACACDLPFISAALAAELCTMAAGYNAAIPMVGGRLQVLHAAYQKSCLPALDAMIAQDQPRLQDLAPRLRARIVSEAEIRHYDPQLLSFFNVNTPAEYARAIELATRRSPGV
jgi:molybdopterin-guanine dinucleotide biosynthesis protein A